MTATDEGTAHAVSDSTLDRMRDVQELIDAGETQENIARFISGADDFTPAERVLARVVLARHGLARQPLRT